MLALLHAATNSLKIKYIIKINVDLMFSQRKSRNASICTPLSFIYSFCVLCINQYFLLQLFFINSSFFIKNTKLNQINCNQIVSFYNIIVMYCDYHKLYSLYSECLYTVILLYCIFYIASNWRTQWCGGKKFYIASIKYKVMLYCIFLYCN